LDLRFDFNFNWRHYDKVSVMRRIFAVRTLQAEMERIVMQLEEEAAEAGACTRPLFGST